MEKRWFYEFDARAKDFGIFDNSTGMLIATTRYGTDEDERNAQLISKASQMLEMLKNVLYESNVHRDFHNSDLIYEIKQLIKEATDAK